MSNEEVNLLMNDEIGTSDFNGDRFSMSKLIDSMSDVTNIKQHHPSTMNDRGAQYNSQVIVDFKPTFVKHVSGLWLLVSGKDSFVEIYSAHTLRKVKVL